MLKFLQFLTLPMFYLGVLWFILFRFPFHDAKLYASYLVTQKWSDEEEEDAS